MKIKAEVKSIDKLKEYFFAVPDYQREYVWKVDDQVEQFIEDIDNEFDENAGSQKGYFIGSIIIVDNKKMRFDVIDGQQRLTTIVLTLCAFRDILKNEILDARQDKYLKTIEEWLFDFDLDSDETQLRLELQYEESKDFLEKLVLKLKNDDEETSSIRKMREAYQCIYDHLQTYYNIGLNNLVSFARYFLTKIELVVIESEELSSALKIFETINQRGAGLNAMDLVKNLLFSQVKEKEFEKIKSLWKEINNNLQTCNEDQSPLRFLRYFFMARYHDGILREDEIYKWLISAEGKRITQYETQPMKLANELVKISKRYSDFVNATMRQKDGGDHPNVTRIGFINKYKSRQHLILLLALKENCNPDVLEQLAAEIESFFFYSNTIGLQAKNNERLFTQWAVPLRKVTDQDNLTLVLDETIFPYIESRIGDFKQAFLNLRHTQYNPLYRQRYILGRMENTVRRLSGIPQGNIDYFDNMQIEHILPQTPKDNILPPEFTDRDDYNSYLYKLGNVTLLESTLNQAVNNCNELLATWFKDKQVEYVKSSIYCTALLDPAYAIGKNTQLNKVKAEYNYSFFQWDKPAILTRQSILLKLAFETWILNGKKFS